jgi:hypothetical protein
MTKTQVINKLKPIIDNLAKKHDWITGKKAMVLAQILIESRWLKSAPQNNCLGIKWTPAQPESRKQMLWTKEFVNGKYISVLAPFMTYSSIEDCIESGYIKVLSLNRYKQTRESKDWWEATNYIRLNGYATSIYYSDTLRNMVLSHKLYTLDFNKNPDEPITKNTVNFKWSESYSGVTFKGKVYSRVIEPYPEYHKNIKSVAENIQTIRNYYNKPLTVTSWFRTPEHNTLQGGSSQSQHLTGSAIDVRLLKGISHNDMEELALGFTKFKGFGYGRTFMHFDIRKTYARWYY